MNALSSSITDSRSAVARGREDGPAKAQRAQPRQQAAVVDVRVRQQHEVDVARLEGPGREVALARLAPALEHAAVDEEAQAFGFDQETGARDLPCSAEERDPRGHPDASGPALDRLL